MLESGSGIRVLSESFSNASQANNETEALQQLDSLAKLSVVPSGCCLSERLNVSGDPSRLDVRSKQQDRYGLFLRVSRHCWEPKQYFQFAGILELDETPLKCICHAERRQPCTSFRSTH